MCVAQRMLRAKYAKYFMNTKHKMFWGSPVLGHPQGTEAYIKRREEVLVVSTSACICYYAACIGWVCCQEQAGVSMVQAVSNASVTVA